MRVAVSLFILICSGVLSAQQPAVTLPDGVKAVWDFDKAYKQTTPTREKICINGLWQWQPAMEAAGSKRQEAANASGDTSSAAAFLLPPAASWGYFKVPGSIPMPGFHHYMQKDSQQVYPHPSWQNVQLRDVTRMWYQREIEIPQNWNNRRIVLKADYVNSRAVVYLGDGRQQTADGSRERAGDVSPPVRVGEILYPSGEVDLTAHCVPGGKYMLTLYVEALPMSDVIAIFGDTNAPRQGTATVNRRGLCGDVFLISEPKGARIADVKIETSVREERITVTVALENLDEKYLREDNDDLYGYQLKFDIYDKNGNLVKRTRNIWCYREEIVEGFVTANITWEPYEVWDIHTPENMYTIVAELSEFYEGMEEGAPANQQDRRDTYYPIRFGFREFWIDGRDLYLNGSRIWLSAVPLCNAQVGAALANYEAAKESMLRLKSFGVNFVYTHNYDCNPGSFISFAEILRAADDVGMLVSFAMPHFGHFTWEPGTVSPHSGDTVAGSLGVCYNVCAIPTQRSLSCASFSRYSFSHVAPPCMPINRR